MDISAILRFGDADKNSREEVSIIDFVGTRDDVWAVYIDKEGLIRYVSLTYTDSSPTLKVRD